MSNTDTIVILIAFAAYLVLMIVIGAIYMKNTNNSEDYFLWRKRTERLGGCAVGTGVGYERLAVDGTSGNRVCTGNRAVLDRDRTVPRNSL